MSDPRLEYSADRTARVWFVVATATGVVAIAALIVAVVTW